MSRVERTCTEVRPGDDGRRRAPESRPLRAYRDAPAYVLLGDPGSGKTTAFETECAARGARALCLTARDFNTFDPQVHREWRDKTIFIDALDEVRAGSSDARTPFNEIRRRLDLLGRPSFRLSCRAADWLGENDRRHLAAVAPQDSQVTVLRLDPLTDADVERILDDRTDSDGARAFIDGARDRGVDGLLENPQSLLLLADVVAVGQENAQAQWPASRLELFERAGLLLATEPDEEHNLADPQLPTRDLLDAAGRLCAVSLVSGAEGFAPRRDQASANYLEIDDCEYDRHLLRTALATRLFSAEPRGRFVPAHRHVAEFVGARHLARVIGEGLPARRVIALLTGEDGAVVTALRGLSAWLAALCQAARLELIERDPIGVVSYGDVHAFSPEHKEALLRALGREASRLTSVTWAPSTLSAVATPGMEPALRGILETRNEQPMALVALVLAALAHGEPLPGLGESLLRVVYEHNRWADAPAMALEAFIHGSDRELASRQLEELLADVAENRLQDWQDRLTAVALRHLYPGRIPPSRIWDHLTESPNQYDREYRSFWRFDLVERTTGDDLPTLLDELTARRHRLKPILESRHLERVPALLLARGLELGGDSIAPQRLLNWFQADLFRGSPRASEETVRRIGAWLEAHPDVQAALIAEYVSRNSYLASNREIDEILYGSDPPPAFGSWCLEQARASTDPRLAKAYLRLALARGVRLEVLWEHERETPPLRDVMREMLVCPLPEGFYDSVAERGNSWQQESSRRRAEFVELVRSHEDELRANRGGAGLLDELANVYYGGSADVHGHNPRDRLRDLFGDRAHLIEATLAGLRGTPFRDDLPDAGQVIDLLTTDRRYVVARPVLAGIDELAELGRLTDRQLRRVLAFHFATFTENSKSRGRRLLNLDSTAAAEVLVQCTAARLRTGNYERTIAYELAVGEYVPLAASATLPLLAAFPLRTSHKDAVAVLDELFVAALRHADRAALVALIARRLSRTSMRATQRVHWLAAETVAAPDTGVDRVREFVGRHGHRVTQLTVFLVRIGPLLDDLPTRTLAALVELLGRSSEPWNPRSTEAYVEVRNGGSELDTEKCIVRMARTLAERPDRETSEALDCLAADKTLGSWRTTLVTARDRQRVIRRDAAYRHPSAGEVCRTLRGGTPANAGDLAALLTARLLELASQIRCGNTDDWRQYWNEPRAQTPTPKHEEQCRDALLSDLRTRLPAGVDAQPEGQYAHDKRADIRVACGDFEVPVEIKKNRHRDLWSAARNQLQAGYARAPATGGYGIYLVFWFGRDAMPPPPEGSLPVAPDGLRMRLESTLTEAERRKLSVVVVDVSRT